MKKQFYRLSPPDKSQFFSQRAGGAGFFLFLISPPDGYPVRRTKFVGASESYGGQLLLRWDFRNGGQWGRSGFTQAKYPAYAKFTSAFIHGSLYPEYSPVLAKERRGGLGLLARTMVLWAKTDPEPDCANKVPGELAGND